MTELHRNDECNVHATIVRVAQLIHAINFDNKTLLRVQPVPWPRALKSEPVATVLEAAIVVVGSVDTKPVFLSEVGSETVVGNTPSTAVTTRVFVLPSRLGFLWVLLLSAFLLLIIVLLLLRISFFRLGVLVFLPRVLVFLLRRFFWFRLLLFFLGGLLFFFLLVVLLLLCVRGNAGSEGQRKNCCADRSNEFHKVLPPLSNAELCAYRKLPVVALTGLPMASPETRSSTLRFCCRPAELPLEATGRLLPKPLAETELAATPCWTR